MLTDPKPEPVDLDALEAQLAADPHAEDYECPRCECAVFGDNETESVFCQDCAYEVAESVVPRLITELRAARSELADREHLEEGARLLTKRLKVSGALGIAEIDWEEAERIRKSKVSK